MTEDWKISLAKFGDGSMAAIECESEDFDEVCIEIMVDRDGEYTPKEACIKAAEACIELSNKMKELAARFERLALEEKPYNADVHDRINGEA